ncbi:MAG: hypothetical protein K2M19_04670 [Muribaculaceae bacterium]|nr:hypothetical protein [Muribaculaceae bacterium]
MKNYTLTLRPLWINHIERFSERMRPRLYGALISYLLHGTPIPERLMPYLGIIIDLIEAEKGETSDRSDAPDCSEPSDVSILRNSPQTPDHDGLRRGCQPNPPKQGRADVPAAPANPTEQGRSNVPAAPFNPTEQGRSNVRAALANPIE